MYSFFLFVPYLNVSFSFFKLKLKKHPLVFFLLLIIALKYLQSFNLFYSLKYIILILGVFSYKLMSVGNQFKTKDFLLVFLYFLVHLILGKFTIDSYGPDNRLVLNYFGATGNGLSPNTLAYIFNTFLLFFLFKRNFLKSSIIDIIFILVIGFVLIEFCQSRSGYIIYLSIIFFYFKNKLSFSYKFLIVFFPLIIYYFITDLNDLFRFDTENFDSGRVLIFFEVFNLVTSSEINFLFGAPFGSLDIYNPFTKTSIVSAHNLFFQLILDFGLFGFIFFVNLIFNLFKYKIDVFKIVFLLYSLTEDYLGLQVLAINSFYLSYFVKKFK